MVSSVDPFGHFFGRDLSDTIGVLSKRRMLFINGKILRAEIIFEKQNPYALSLDAMTAFLIPKLSAASRI